MLWCSGEKFVVGGGGGPSLPSDPAKNPTFLSVVQ